MAHLVIFCQNLKEVLQLPLLSESIRADQCLYLQTADTSAVTPPLLVSALRTARTAPRTGYGKILQVLKFLLGVIVLAH